MWSRALLLFGHRQRVPWLGYRAVERLAHLIRPEWSVLEFGSGMSTLFLAPRCARVVSVESDPLWHARIAELLEEKQVTNVELRLRDVAEYTEHADLPDGSFDLVIVDGIVRDRAAVVAARKVTAGGYIFLDNSDVPWPDHAAARETVLDMADRDGVEYFRDFYPFQVIVNESLLVRVRGQARG